MLITHISWSLVYEASHRHCVSTCSSPLRISIIELLDPFQAIKHDRFGVMFPLVLDRLPHPVQILRAKTDDAVPNLSLQRFLMHSQFLIDVVRRTTFELSNPITDRQCRGNGHG